MKKIERGVIHECKRLDLQGSLDDVISYLEGLRDGYSGKDLILAYIENEGCDRWGECRGNHAYILSTRRKETDEEYQARLAVVEASERDKREEAKRRRQQRKQADLELYEKLHKKYGTKGGRN